MTKSVLFETARKQAYRVRLYDFVARYRRDSYITANHNKTIAILDTSAALETIYALKQGYRQIYVVDRNVPMRSRAAWKALHTVALKRAGVYNLAYPSRLQYNDALRAYRLAEKSYPSIAFNVAERRLEEVSYSIKLFPGEDLLDVVNGRHFDFINFDACCPINGVRWLRYVNDLASRVAPGGIFALSLLAGREQKNAYRVFDKVKTRALDYDKPNSINKGKYGGATGKHALRMLAVHIALNHGHTRMCADYNSNFNELVDLYRGYRVPIIHAAFRVTQNCNLTLLSGKLEFHEYQNEEQESYWYPQKIQRHSSLLQYEKGGIGSAALLLAPDISVQDSLQA